VGVVLELEPVPGLVLVLGLALVGESGLAGHRLPLRVVLPVLKQSQYNLNALLISYFSSNSSQSIL
jgi:hypothetical protein